MPLFRSAERELPKGHMIRIYIVTTWGDPHYTGLTSVQVCVPGPSQALLALSMLPVLGGRGGGGGHTPIVSGHALAKHPQGAGGAGGRVCFLVSIFFSETYLWSSKGTSGL